MYVVELDLKSKSPVTIEDGDVVVDKGYSKVTVRNIKANSAEDAFTKARLIANTFLNELSYKHDINLEIGNSATAMIQSSPTTRHLNGLNIKMSIKGGQKKRFPRVLKEVKIKPSDAKAYYRKAEISTDVFDQFRNYYLVIENIGSKLAKLKGRTKTQGLELTRSAMKECFSSDLHSLEEFKQVRGFVDKGDTIKDLAELLYKRNRCQLDHARYSENRKIPFNTIDEMEVGSALQLVKFVARSLISYEDTNLS